MQGEVDKKTKNKTKDYLFPKYKNKRLSSNYII